MGTVKQRFAIFVRASDVCRMSHIMTSHHVTFCITVALMSDATGESCQPVQHDNILGPLWAPVSLWVVPVCLHSVGVLRFAWLPLQRFAESDLVYSRVVTQVGPDCRFITIRHAVCFLFFFRPLTWFWLTDRCLSVIWKISCFLREITAPKDHTTFCLCHALVFKTLTGLLRKRAFILLLKSEAENLYEIHSFLWY